MQLMQMLIISGKISEMVKKDLIQIISQASGASPSATKMILKEADRQIILGLKNTRKVQVRNFGTFRLKKAKSKTVYDISNKKGKIILLESDTVKFMPSPIFKNRLMTKQPAGSISKVQDKLRNFIFSKSGDKTVTHPDPETSPSAKVFGSIIRSCIKQDIPYLMLELDESPDCFIRYGLKEKREILTKIPTAIARRYIGELFPDLDKQNPEEYFVKFAFGLNTSKINNKEGSLRYWTYPAKDRLLVRIQISNE